MLEAADVPQAFALTQTIGWNQTPDDWRLAIEMSQGGCFAMEHEGSVIATVTSIRYGNDLAWIGMVLTHPEHRGRGHARALMTQILDHLSDVATVKLDATEMGTPLYRELGFVDECVIERWQGQAAGSMEPIGPYLYPEFDRQAFGADRSALLERLAGIEAASVEDGFAMGRGDRFGPCVARSKQSAMRLARWYLARHADKQLIWDLFPENNIAQELGFELSRRLMRMRRGRRLPSKREWVYAGAGFEFG